MFKRILDSHNQVIFRIILSTYVVIKLYDYEHHQIA